jgi:hypothetical protein
MKKPPYNKRLVTVKKAHQEIGSSIGFFKQLLRDGKLTKYKINSCTYLDLYEFVNLALPVNAKIEITKRLTQEEVSSIRLLFERGVTLNDIAEHYGTWNIKL